VKALGFNFLDFFPCSNNLTCSMNSSDKTTPLVDRGLGHAQADAVLVRDGGVPFHPPMGVASGIDPFAEWLSLMEVVQMLCSVWSVRDGPMLGDHCRL
jgi:hypothetical protein